MDNPLKPSSESLVSGGLSSRLGISALLLITILSVAQTSTAQTTPTLTADSYVDSSNPTSNFGTQSILKVGYTYNNNGSVASVQRSLVKFDLSAVSGLPQQYILAATLKLYVTKFQPYQNNVNVSVGLCAPGFNSWNENTVNWQSQPYNYYYCAHALATAANQTVSIDVTQYVRNVSSGQFDNGLILLEDGPGSVTSASKESGSNAPRLEIFLNRISSVTGTGGLTGGGTNGDLVLGIADSGVTSSKLADNSVTSQKIAAGAVGTVQLANGAVTSEKIISGAVGAAQIAVGSVGTPQLSDGAVTTSKLAPGAVGSNQIAVGAITTNHLVSGAITADKVSSGQLVKSLNNLTDNVTLVAGDNVAISQSGNSLTISSITGGPSTPAPNPLQLATLRWYGVNESEATINVGHQQPLGVAFDGQNMWVVNFTCALCPGTIYKHRLSDGAVIGTFNVGSAPVFASFDGSNIWVGNRDSDNVTKLRASDGALLGTFPTGGSGPQWIAFDGANIWVTNGGSNSVVKMRISDGTVLSTHPTGVAPHGVVYDGSNIWVANGGSSSVTKLRASDGANLGTFAVGSQPVQMAFDGANVWVSNLSSNTVSKLRASDGATLGTFNVNSPHGIAFDGANIWVVSRFGTTVTKLRASDGSVLATSQVGTWPWGIAFDGINMWISNYGSNSISKR